MPRLLSVTRSGDLVYRIASAFLAVLAVLAPSAAGAHEATIAYPIHSTDGTYIVQVNAGPGTWQIRRSARQLNAQLAVTIPQLQIRTSGDCGTADVCVSVEVGSWDEPEMLEISGGVSSMWAGLIASPNYDRRIIYLNRLTGYISKDRARAARHELGHALGLDHHYGPGIVGSYRDSGPLLSESELRALAAQYASS